MEKFNTYVAPFIFAAAFIISLFWGIDCVINNKKKQKIFAVIVCSILFALTCFFLVFYAAG